LTLETAGIFALVILGAMVLLLIASVALIGWSLWQLWNLL
jgi:hypothetical protein